MYIEAQAYSLEEVGEPPRAELSIPDLGLKADYPGGLPVYNIAIAGSQQPLRLQLSWEKGEKPTYRAVLGDFHLPHAALRITLLFPGRESKGESYMPGLRTADASSKEVCLHLV